MELTQSKYNPVLLEGVLCEHFDFSCEKTGDPQRFTALFESVWSQIPEECRAKMIAHWEAKGEGRPRVELLWYWGGQNPMSLASFEESQNYGECYLFWIPFVDLAPVDCISHVIAHELAHGYQKATGYNPEGAGIQNRHTKNDDPFVRRYLHFIDPLEKNAKLLTRNWGFSSKARAVWERMMQNELALTGDILPLLRELVNDDPPIFVDKWRKYAADLRTWEEARKLDKRAKRPVYPFSREEIKSLAEGQRQ